MRRHLKHILWMTCCIMALLGLFAVGANAYNYPTMPSNWQDIKITVGDVTMPFERYPNGAAFSSQKSTMTVAEQRDYGLNLGRELNLRGWECVGFARYAYAALFYKYPENASIDTTLGYSYSSNYAYINMVEKVLGSKTLDAGYSASTLKTLITACRPGALIRVNGHSMVIMAIFDDGLIIYDGNYSGSAAVSVRRYTYNSFVSTFGYRGIEALHMPAYYPGYSYSTGGSDDGYDIDFTKAGTYEVYNCKELNVRAKPQAGSTRVGTIKSGTIIQVLGTYNNWAKISFERVMRWVSMEYLRQKNITVTFDANGGTVSKQSASYQVGQSFGEMPVATKKNRTLVGWYSGDTVYDSSSRVPNVDKLTLKARWCVLEYRDVLEDSWYASYVEAAYNQGLASKDTLFNPEQTAPRCQMVTVLGRLHERASGEKLTNTATNFADVSPSSYYAPYVAWGAQTGIVMGSDANSFQPDENVTREQIAVFLHRYAVYGGYTASGSGNESYLWTFKDGASVSGYARAAVAWAVETGILTGDDGFINPKGPAKRCEMFTMFSRYITYCESHKPQYSTVTITFDPNGGSVSERSRRCTEGEKLGQLPTGSKSGCVLIGWFLGDTQYTAATAVPNQSVTLTARWGVRNYQDIPENHWAAKSIATCYDYGMLESGSTFDPNRATSRAEVMTMLGRGYEVQTKQTITASTTAFTDVSMAQDYGRYVAWAAEKGIAKGITATTFGPDQQVTRGQLCLFLYRMACTSGTASESTPEDETNLNKFVDGSRVDATYRQAISWAVRVGIINGMDDGNIAPETAANHVQVITVLARYLDFTAGRS